jgi:hypothetical protein
MRFDALDLHDLYATLGYYLGRRQQVQLDLARQEQGSLAARREAQRQRPRPRSASASTDDGGPSAVLCVPADGNLGGDTCRAVSCGTPYP